MYCVPIRVLHLELAISASDPVITLAPQKPLPKWVKWLCVIAVSCAVIFAIVSIVSELRRQAIRGAEWPAFQSVEQGLIGFDTSGAANATWTVPQSQATFVLIAPYCLSDDIDNHPELKGVVPTEDVQYLAIRGSIEAPFLIGYRDGVMIHAQHIYSPYRWDGSTLVFRQGDQLSLQRTGGVIHLSVSPQSK